jgi:hypothetical protein
VYYPPPDSAVRGPIWCKPGGGNIAVHSTDALRFAYLCRQVPAQVQHGLAGLVPVDVNAGPAAPGRSTSASSGVSVRIR